MADSSFDFCAFLDAHFPNDAAQTLPQQYGFAAPTAGALRKWRERGNIPGEWFAVLLVVCEFENGATPSLLNFART